MDQIRPIPLDAVPRALARAERYRLLNEPREAESICRDVLAVDPGNQQALVALVLAMTDLFAAGETAPADVQPFLARLTSPVDREYYAGVIEERWGKVLMLSGECRRSALDYLRQAMRHYDAVQRMGNGGGSRAAAGTADAGEPGVRWDAVLRWNTCVRMIERHGLEACCAEETASDAAEEDVPARERTA